MHILALAGILRYSSLVPWKLQKIFFLKQGLQVTYFLHSLPWIIAHGSILQASAYFFPPVILIALGFGSLKTLTVPQALKNAA